MGCEGMSTVPYKDQDSDKWSGWVRVGNLRIVRSGSTITSYSTHRFNMAAKSSNEDDIELTIEYQHNLYRNGNPVASDNAPDQFTGRGRSKVLDPGETHDHVEQANDFPNDNWESERSATFNGFSEDDDVHLEAYTKISPVSGTNDAGGETIKAELCHELDLENG